MAVAMAVALPAFVGSSASASVNARRLLREAKRTLDSTHAVHFRLSSTDVSGSGTSLTGGEGDAARPDALRGSFTVNVDGIGATVGVAAKNGVFEVRLPFSKSYTRTNPATLGIGDPSQLMNPTTGLSALLTSGAHPRLTGRERLAGELLDVVTTKVPGRLVPILPNAKPSRPVTLVAAIDQRDHQARQLSLRGYFTSATTQATYALRLTRYGESVSIGLPTA